jgi:hypothetical protein
LIVETKIVTMTPEWAEQLLALNTHNRKLSRNTVLFYESLINRRQWKTTHQGIAVDWNNVLQDGQHRLHAIVRTGQSVQILLSTKVDPSNYEAIDGGKKRSAADTIGLVGAKNATQIAAAIRAYLLYQKYPAHVWVGNNFNAITISDIKLFYESAPESINELAASALKAYKKFRPLNASALICFLLLAKSSDRVYESLEFVDRLGSGENLNTYDPILLYRSFLSNNKAPRGLQFHVASNIKMFGKWLKGEDLRQFRVPEFPPMPIIALPVTSFAGSDQ